MPVKINEIKIRATVAGTSPDAAVVCVIAIDGKPISDTYAIQSVDISLLADARAVASFTIADDVVNGLPATNDADFEPGKPADISIGYYNDVKKLFSGIIIAQSLTVSEHGNYLSMTCESAAAIPADKSKADAVLSLMLGSTIIDLSADLRKGDDNNLQVRGNVSYPGNALVAPGNSIEMQRVGANINGIHQVSSVYHTLSKGNWTTTATFGDDHL